MLRYKFRPVVLLFGGLLVATGTLTLVAQDLPKTLVATIQERNRISRQLIRTIVAKYEQKQDMLVGGRKPNARIIVDWWQDGELVRCNVEEKIYLHAAFATEKGTQQKPPKTVVSKREFVIKGGEISSTVIQNTSEKQASIRHFRPNTPLSYNLWVDSLFVLASQSDSTLADLMQPPNDVTSVKTIVDEKEKRISLTIRPLALKQEQLFEIEVNPKFNYLVTRLAVQSLSKTDRSRSDSRAVMFREVAPGIHFPIKIERKTFVGKQQDDVEVAFGLTETHFYHVAVNQPIDHKIFDLSIPAGMAVVDYRDNSRYVVGKHGEPTDRVDGVPIAAAKAVLPSYKEETRHSTGYFLWAGGAVLFGMFVFFVRRWGKPKTAS